MTAPFLRRPLPDFQRWLDASGHADRAPGFEPMADLARRSQLPEGTAHLKPDEASFARLWAGLSIAVVELCNIETEHGRSTVEIAQMLPRALAAAAFYATVSVLEDAPWRSIAKILTEEFRFGANTSADGYAASLEREGK